MQLCEMFLLCIIIVLGICVIVTDFYFGLIKNKILLAATIPGAIINSIYMIFFAGNYFPVYLLNWCAVSVIAILLYVFHFWAAGDSKLTIVLTFLIPARYYGNSLLLISSIYQIIFIFLIAYFYIIIESIVLTIKKRKFFKERYKKQYRMIFVWRYIVSYLYLRILSIAFQNLFGEFYFSNRTFFSFIIIFVVLYIHEREVFYKNYIIAIVVIISMMVAFRDIIHGVHFVSLHILCSYGIVLVALFLRYLVSGYNYEEIPTSTVKKGMVLSYSTVIGFSVSKVKGLPQTTNEDMSSKITEEEAEAIQRWETSKYGKNTILIVRKIPFAAFVVYGTICYIVMRIILTCL